ncbi:MAG: hypothetical protein H6747_01330 [Deltaproteobacteria bacterium]|nr:hypothetical protein [Polyangiaceae bacterium]MCB9737875.1 hypothetical protein [Deltaproteobacteria bacterium]
MEPALDEASLVPCPTTPPARRICALAEALGALDKLGAPRILRSVRNAADRDLRDSHGLRHWCFDRQTPRDAGRFVAQRLGKAPFIDGSEGLFALAEGERAIQPSIGGVRSLAGGQVALTDSLLVLLGGSTWPPNKPVIVRLDVLTDEDEWTDEVTVDAADCAEEVEAIAASITRKIEAAVSSGQALVDRLSELFPRLALGTRAEAQIAALTGGEPFFPQVLRHLRALERAAENWTQGTPFSPEGVTYSVESEATLKHGSLGPLRDFPTPPGFDGDRWTLHTKLTGGNGARMYYKVQEFQQIEPGEEPARRVRIALGYVGPHLPTARFR